MQRYAVYLYLETAVHVSGGTSSHHQERNTTVSTASSICTPLLLPAAIAAGSSNGVTLIYTAKKIPPPIVCILLFDFLGSYILVKNISYFLKLGDFCCCYYPVAVFSTNEIEIVFKFYCRFDDIFHANQA